MKKIIFGNPEGETGGWLLQQWPSTDGPSSELTQLTSSKLAFFFKCLPFCQVQSDLGPQDKREARGPVGERVKTNKLGNKIPHGWASYCLPFHLSLECSWFYVSCLICILLVFIHHNVFPTSVTFSSYCLSYSIVISLTACTYCLSICDIKCNVLDPLRQFTTKFKDLRLSSPSREITILK